jgi:type III pantothenate kinase
MGEALHRGTAKLPSVDIVLTGEVPEPRVRALGKSTTASMISGMIYGTAGAVERILRVIEAEEDCEFKVVLTGGYSDTMARFIERGFSLDPDLTLRGLRLIYERNS